jgi:predicted nucleotidyltransferase
MLPAKTDFEAVFRALVPAEVQFIVIGGVAAILHGTARITYDVDVVYARDRGNIRRLVAALKPFAPYLRGVPKGLPFAWDERTVLNGLNFTLETNIGDVDLLGEVTGGGTYADLLPHSQDGMAFGFPCKVVTLEKLIVLKQAAGRPKDLEPIAELQALLEEKRKLSGGESPASS